MAKVSNLKIDLQNGTDSSYYATWEFKETTTTTSNSAIKKGSLVSIKSSATKWYNGVSIPSWVKNYKWYVVQVSGDRVVLGKSSTGGYNIQSPINIKDLSGGSGSTTTTTTDVKNLDHYEVKWYYATGDGIWFTGSSGDETRKLSTYSPPANATKIKVTVKPVSKKYKSGNTEKSYWTGSSVSLTYLIASSPPPDAEKPNVEIKNYTLTATVTVGNDLADARIDQVEFQVYNGTTKCNTGTVTVKMQNAKFTCTVKAGGKYRVRCRYINLHDKAKVYGKWSEYSDEKETVPVAVAALKCVADSKTSVKLTWKSIQSSSSKVTYEIEYTTDKKYFDTSSQVSSMNVDGLVAYVTGLESGDEWYFRVRARNDQGESTWSTIVSAIIGTEPEAPTTWSLSNTVIMGEPITLYWVHNTEDGSKMTKAEVEITLNGVTETVTVPGASEEDEDEAEPIYSYIFSSTEYTSGGKIYWRVRTKGIYGTTDNTGWSDWSTKRTIDLYARPSVEVSLSTNDDEILTTFPLDIDISAGPAPQKPLSFYVSITSTDTYESVDIRGSEVLVTSGTEVYSKIFNVSDSEFKLSISAGDVMLENNQTYELKVIAAMDSGLTAEVMTAFTVSWEDYAFVSDAGIAIDPESLSAYITPFCTDDNGDFVEDVTLSVYRREYNGLFTEIATGISNTGFETVTDPHPSLDYARYRVVAQHTGTGSISYEDLPGHPILEHAIIIQWDEKWSNFNYVEEDAPEFSSWTGSMLRLPYNVDVTEKYNNDVSLIEYIGREHPVSYYGTQRGETASWSTAIDKADKDTIYALRRLAAWRGDVYIREPSGTGYWANVTVNFPIKHGDLTVPVTFDISRVEGGV